MKSLKLFLALMILFGSACEAYARGDGTWPLRLRGGDGTWPLRFNGEAVSLQDPDASSIGTGLTITDLTEDAMADDTPATFTCAGEGVAHLAQGVVKVGSTSFSIIGICYFEETDTIEIVSELEIRRGRQVVIAKSLMTGKVPEEAESADKFMGRINVGNNAAEQGRYKFEINKVERLGRSRG